MGEGLRLEGLRLRRGWDILVSLDRLVRPGEILTIMGPSGSGKSTLLAGLTGILPRGFAMDGRVLLDGRDITGAPPQQRRIGILFQDDLLFPHLDVAGNLAFGLPPGLTRAERRRRVAVALEEADLAGFASRDPATLSGGQKARVALLRMLLSEPRALLLDEPFAALDVELRNQIRRLVFDKAQALPVVFVTHDRDDAAAAGGDVVGLTKDWQGGQVLERF